MATMLIDHIGFIFFPDTETLRVIGRIALPIYAFLLVQGYKYTSNLKRYGKRLLILALISQIPFSLVINTFRLNVIFTLLISLFVIWLLETKKKSVSIPLIVGLMLIAEFADYGIYLIVLTLIYRKIDTFKGKGLLKNPIFEHTVLNLGAFFLYGWYLQFFSVFATIIIKNRNKLKEVKINKAFYRMFYPAHLLILFVISILIK